jgi:hypothetical protein
MILPTKTVMKLTGNNLERVYLAIQNMDSTATNIIYLLFQEAEPEVFKNTGFVVGGYGLLEIQNCMSRRSKMPIYAYTEVAAGVDVRVLEV